MRVLARKVAFNAPNMQLGMGANIRQTIIDLLLITIGTLIAVGGVVIFMAPFEIAPSGVTGIAVILYELIGTPVGLVVFLLNVPLLYLGYRYLPGGFPMIASTIYSVILYSVAIDAFMPLMSSNAVSDDRLLNAIFGGILVGIGCGFVYRAGTTYGGTSIIARILQRRTGMSLTTTFLYTDTAVILMAGLVFGLEGGLYALVVLFISGVATDYVTEGPSVIRNVTIITDKPDEVSNVIMQHLVRGVTAWEGRGMYTGNERSILFVTVSRSQVADLRQIVGAVDDECLIVIGQGHNAYGAGFKPILPHSNGMKKAS